MKQPEIHMINDKTYFPKMKVGRIAPNITIQEFNPGNQFPDHPMQCEEFVYERTKIYELSVADYELQTTPYHKHDSEHLIYTVKNVLRDPAVEWAVMKSFDGVYIYKHFDHAFYRTILQFYVYMEPKHSVFWTLKFSNNNQRETY